MRASFFPRFLRDGFIRLRRMAAVPGILAPAGLAMLAVWAVIGNCDATALLAALALMVVAFFIRLLDLRSDGMKPRASWSLTIVAVMMPRVHALRYIEDHGATLEQVACPRQRRAIVINTLGAAPRTLATTWSWWLHTQMVRGVVLLVQPRVDQLKGELTESPPLLLCTPPQLRMLLSRWRRLGRYCMLVRFAAGSWQYPHLANTASTLAARCQRLAAEVPARTAQDRPDLAVEIALSLQVNQGTRELSAALSNWRAERESA